MKNAVILKAFCKKMFIGGYGNFWYEDGDGSVGDDTTIRYIVYSRVLFFLYGVMAIMEALAAFIGDFPDEEKSESVTLSFCHVIVVSKTYIMIYNKNKIKLLGEKMVTICEPYEEQEVMEEKFKMIKINVFAYAASVFVTLFLFILQAIEGVLAGSHFVTIITYYPSYGNNSLLANLVRIFFTLVFVSLILNMVFGLDGFTVTHTIMLKYKFVTLRNYFNALRDDVYRIKETGNAVLASKRLTNGLAEGINMHRELLRIALELDDAFGTVTALQLFLCSGTAVAILLQIALTESLSFVTLMRMVLFVAALAMLLGLSLCNAGEILYEASLLSDTIFYCGWHEVPPLAPPHANHNKLVLLAMMQAQRPLIMKAFKMIELTYATYLQVGRITYSTFALFYAQNKKKKSK